MRQVTFGPIGERYDRFVQPARSQEEIRAMLAQRNAVVEAAIAAAAQEEPRELVSASE
jgi:hypothetical protein